MGVRHRIMRSLAALLILLAFAAPAAAADAVVLDGAAKEAGLAPGSVLAAGDAVRLAEGERLQILFQSGEIVTIEGPFEGAIGAGDGQATGLVDTVAALILGHSGTSDVVGASRKAAGGAFAPQADILAVNVDSSGVRCIGDRLILWRSDTDAAAEITARSAHGRAGPLEWASGEAMLPLPDDLAQEGPLAVSIGDQVRRLELKKVPDSVGEAPGRLLLWLGGAGCERQASLLVDAIRGQ
ncbi:hypothetical protein [Acuticoccus kandeliae]|uniref:hypothetical protein n=1 Tax=Acuticoccus kandeliae TaxID=2073160 RepID=UPI0013004486|nr:hypothetical protein [Acuticoccus kandeliae]